MAVKLWFSINTSCNKLYKKKKNSFYMYRIFIQSPRQCTFLIFGNSSLIEYYRFCRSNKKIRESTIPLYTQNSACENANSETRFPPVLNFTAASVWPDSCFKHEFRSFLDPSRVFSLNLCFVSRACDLVSVVCVFKIPGNSVFYT